MYTGTPRSGAQVSPPDRPRKGYDRRVRRGLTIAAVLAVLLCVLLLALAWWDRQPKGRAVVRPPPVARTTRERDTGPRSPPVTVQARAEVARVVCRYGGSGEPGRLWAEGEVGRVDGAAADVHLVLDLEPGRWRVWWARPSRGGDERSVLVHEVEVSGGDVLACDLTDRGYLVRGRVVDRAGRAVEGATVGGCLMDAVVSEADGSFQAWVRGVGSGRLPCRLQARWTDGLLTRFGSTASVNPFNAATPVELVVDDEPVAGVGIRFERDADAFVVSGVEPESPADRAELLPGDRVLRVDGTGTEAMSTEEFVAKVTGSEGTTVRLELDQDGDLAVVDLRRERIAPPSAAD